MAPKVNKQGKELEICPCSRCRNLQSLRPHTIAGHIREFGLHADASAPPSISLDQWLEAYGGQPGPSNVAGTLAHASSAVPEHGIDPQVLAAVPHGVGNLSALQSLPLTLSGPFSGIERNITAADLHDQQPPAPLPPTESQLPLGLEPEQEDSFGRIEDDPGAEMDTHGNLDCPEDNSAGIGDGTLGEVAMDLDNNTGEGEGGYEGDQQDSDHEMGFGDMEGGAGQMGSHGHDANTVEEIIPANAAQAIQHMLDEPVPQPFDGYDDVPITPATLENVKIAQEFAEAISNATLENGGLDKASIAQLRKPTAPQKLTDDEALHLDMYIALSDATQKTYTNVKEVLDRHTEVALPSQYVMANKVKKMTGIIEISDDMCVNGCHAFTGPCFGILKACSICGEARYEQKVLQETGKKVPRKRMTTIPLGPQIQALRQLPEGAKSMRYRDQKTKDILEEMESYTSMEDAVYDNIFSGADYLKLHQNLNLTEDDTLVNFAMDGAQLYQNKKSDTWIAVWIVQEYNPKVRFKRKHMLPVLIVPGPHKPKNLESYTYRSMHHLSSIQREDGGRGIKCWDGEKGRAISSRTILLLNLADAVGLPDIDGRVGHHGAHGCQVGCDMLGRNKPGQGHYYAAHLRPYGYGETNAHPDTDTTKIKSPTVEQYNAQLAHVESSRDTASYKQNRKDTGISKRSILSGLVQIDILPPPKSFSVDLMHLFSLNFGELMMSLFRGKLKCEATDDISNWDWAVLQGPKWTEFGQLVANASTHFPSSFHRPPRNPAEKINSKYKATEYYLLVFGLGPGLLRSFLPRKYWRHFCKLVRAVCILTQRRITAKQLKDAQYFAIQFSDEYESLYYQRRLDRIHFCRPMIHTLLHVPPETQRVGPGTYYMQYENERAIGDFGKEIRQPSNPFGNLAQIAIRQSRKNAIKVIYPFLDPEKPPPRGSRNLNNGYILLTPHFKETARGGAGTYLRSEIGTDRVEMYGRMVLPNRQLLRSLYSESNLISRAPNVSRNCKIIFNGETMFGEIQFFFMLVTGKDPITRRDTKVPRALVLLYGSRIEDIWEDSYKTAWACTLSANNYRIIDIPAIDSVISMQPMPSMAGDPENMWCVVEKCGLEDLVLSGYSDTVDEEHS